jgi:DNA-binding NtrC family response regulator
MPPPKPVVVVIEDQPELGQVIREVLGGEGFDVKPVPDTASALQTLREEEKVVLLVSDLSSTDTGSGDPLAPVAGEFPELPVIVIRDQRADDVPFFGPWRAEGSRILLRRPFRLDDLIAASREVQA